MSTPINTFKTFAAELDDTGDDIYTAPVDITSIVLMAQVSNVTSTTETVTVIHDDGVAQTELVKDFPVPGNDSVSVLTGKLVLESGSSLFVVAGSDSVLKIVVSVLETRDV
jgi:hypothetical protein